MQRYIVPKEALDILHKSGEDAISVIASNRVITNEVLVYRSLPFVNMPLDARELQLLKSRGIKIEIDKTVPVKLLGPDYEKIHTRWIKPVRRLETGIGCKVAVWDSGCAIAHVPVDFAYNFVDDNTTIVDTQNHGTRTTSIIKSSIGLAPGCEMHHLKLFNSTGSMNVGVMIVAADYCVTNEIDIVSMSWQVTNDTGIFGLDACIAAGIVMCAACGNSGSPTETEYPANYPEVVAVNSIRENGLPHHYSYIAPAGRHGVTLACNGSTCQVISNSGSITTDNGTSFSSPFFAGAFALYKQRLGLADNYAVLEEMKKRFIKSDNVVFTNLLTF